MDEFSTKTYTVRQLLKNEMEEMDRGKNYFIPPSQRKYDWTTYEVDKLINDITDEVNRKVDDNYQSYFIGGIVLSRQSMIDDKRSAKSLEVIDGQQRLSSIVLILASIVQLFEFQDLLTDTEKDEGIINHFINDISKLLKRENLNLKNMSVEEQYILERSDELSIDFNKMVDTLLNEKIYSKDQLYTMTQNNDDSKKLVNLVYSILTNFKEHDTQELVEFLMQLLNNTWMVVTKTDSIETGFFIFEKLNDSGMKLNPEDLLKNYLFRTTDNLNYDELTNKWKNLLDTIKSINKSRAKIFPSEFLDQYLTIVGRSSKGKIFKMYGDVNRENFGNQSLKLLDDLILLAEEYNNIKSSKFSVFIDLMKFKLAYLIVLSFFKKYENNYIKYSNQILSIIVRIGLTYLLTGQSKNLSLLIPSICKDIMESKLSISETIEVININITKKLELKIDVLDETISNTNLWRKKSLSSLLLKLVEYQINQTSYNANQTIFKIMPAEFNDEDNYVDILEETSGKYSNYIGNIIINNDKIDSNESRFNKRYICKSDIVSINNVFIYFNTNGKIKFEKLDNNIHWGKQSILDRSQNIADLAKYILVKNNIKESFFEEY